MRYLVRRSDRNVTAPSAIKLWGKLRNQDCLCEVQTRHSGEGGKKGRCTETRAQKMRARAFGRETTWKFIAHPEENNQWQDREERAEKDDLTEGNVVADGFDADEHSSHQHP
jgi:hypothetical protein